MGQIVISAQEPSDTTIQLNEVVVGATQTAARKLTGGSVSLNSAALTTGIHTLGEADFVSQIKRLSGIAISNDYTSGISVDGNDPSASLFRISGTPVFFPYRFGGFFSAFNSQHFSGARFERGIHDASMPNRIGALVDMRPNLYGTRLVSGEINLGMLASSLTTRVPVSQKFMLTLSARVSYIDELYKWVLRGNDTQTAYNFSDFNITACYRPDSVNTLLLETFHSGDRLSYNDSHYAMDSYMKWNNSVASFQWKHHGRINMSHRLEFTDFNNRLNVDMTRLKFETPSKLQRLGLAGEISIPVNRKLSHITTGYEISQYFSKPLYAFIDGYGASGHTVRDVDVGSTEVRVYADTRIMLSYELELKAGLSATYYHNGNYNTCSVDPRLTLLWNGGPHSLAFHLGCYHQYLQQTGFSEIGLAADSWYLASRKLKPESSAGVNAEWIFNTGIENLEFSAGTYWRYIDNQVEYEGSLLELADNDYVAEDHLLSCNGFNTGFSVGVQRYIGNITGTASYSYGVALRHYRHHPGWLHARTDPGHSFKANLSYRLSDHWTVSAQFSYASGRTYTPTRSIYVIAENLICQYGERNSARLPSYQRLDLSGTYSFIMHLGNKDLRSHVNLSLINAYGHRNVEMQTFVIDSKTGRYRLKRYNSLYQFLPSISFKVCF